MGIIWEISQIGVKAERIYLGFCDKRNDLLCTVIKNHFFTYLSKPISSEQEDNSLKCKAICHYAGTSWKVAALPESTHVFIPFSHREHLCSSWDSRSRKQLCSVVPLGFAFFSPLELIDLGSYLNVSNLSREFTSYWFWGILLMIYPKIIIL